MIMRDRLAVVMAVHAVLVAIALTLAAESARSAPSGLAVRLVNGQGRSYAFDQIERMYFDDDVLYVAEAGETNGCPLRAICRLEPLRDEWTGTADAPESQGQVTHEGLVLLNRPNPFGPETLISFELARRAAVDLRVYSPDGRLVRTLLVDARDPGPHTVLWDCRDDAGHGVAGGVYFARLVSGDRMATKKLVLVR
jgi:hypothetical protein